MSDNAADIRDRLHNLATLAPPGAGISDPADIVDLHHAKRRRTAGWAGLAAAIALFVLGATTLLPQAPDAEPANQVAGPSALGPARGLYDLPPRGSLAGNDGLILEAMAASWDDGTWNSGSTPINPPTDTRRVSYIGEVPGGQARALVMGLVGDQLYFTWFADTDTSNGITWQRAWGPDKAFPDTPMALLDDAGDSGALVVVASPGDQVEFTSTGAETDGTPPTYQTLTTDDGVAVAEVPSPQYPTFSLGFRIIRDGDAIYEQPPQRFDSTQPLGPQAPYQPLADAPPPEEYGQRMADCLQPLGFDVQITGTGDGFSYNSTTDNEQAFDEAVDVCASQTGYE